MSALALIDGVLPWVSESARRDLVKARDAMANLVEAAEKINALNMEADGATCEWPEAVAAARSIRAALAAMGDA